MTEGPSTPPSGTTSPSGTPSGPAAREDRHAHLARLADAAVRDFGVLCFWSVPGASDLAALTKAKLAARLLQKHGGARGLRAAAEIEAGLRAVGETPWR